MRYLFLAPPAAGEMQPVLAVAAALLHLQPQATVCIASASSFDGAFQRFKSSLDDSVAARLLRSDIGRTDDVEDYSRRMLARDPSKHPRLFGTHRHARGNPIPFFDYWQAFAAGSEEQRLATIQRILRLVDAIRPDMIIVDQIYGTPYDAVRYSKLPFVVIAPGHPSFAADVNPMREPLSMSGIQWTHSLSNIKANFSLIYKLVKWVAGSQWAWTTLKLRRWTLGFRWLSFSADSMITPPPGEVQEVCAAVMCNVKNLNFYHTWPSKCHFVGPCFRPNIQKAKAQEDDSLQDWLDDAHKLNLNVIYISFGSMFPFVSESTLILPNQRISEGYAQTEEDYRSMLKALVKVHQEHPRIRVLWKVVRCEGVQKQELPFVRQESWLPSVERVYAHPAVKIVIHHGGGNTANEVIYYGLRHLVIPQWSDTYDWAATIASFGLGEQVENEGPRLDSDEIARKLLKLLNFPQQYRDNIAYWSRQSRASSGAKGAARIIQQAALEQAPVYDKAFRTKQAFMTTFTSGI